MVIGYLSGGIMYKITKLLPWAVLLIMSAAMAQPSLISPTNGLWVYDRTPCFIWNNVSGATQYRIQVSEVSNFVSTNINTTTTDSNYQVPESGPLAETLYYWRVRAETPLGDWSDVFSFRIELKGPDPISPPGDGTIDSRSPTFFWYLLPGSERYRLVVTPDGSISPVINDSTIFDTTYTAVTILDPGVYNWYLQGKDSLGNWSTPSEPWRFTLVLPPPDLISPANNAKINNQSPEFNWSAVDDAVKYNLLVKNGFNIAVISETTDATRFTPLRALDPGTYTWKVKTKDANGNWGSYSSPWTFSLDITPPDVPVIISPAAIETLRTRPQVFKWHAVSQVDTYKLRLAGIKTDFLTTDTTMTLDLSNNNYQWQVAARDSYGNWSDLSVARTLTVAVPTWVRRTDILSPNSDTLKAVSDGGALVAVSGSKASDFIYAFHGNKSNRFYKYTPVIGAAGSWLEKDSLKFRNKKIPPLYQADKKYVAAGASLAYDEADGNIYAIKGGGTRELWVYSISGDSWHYLNEVGDMLPQTKGVKNGSCLVYDWYDGRIYLLAGIANKADSNRSFACYTPSNHTWTILYHLPLETPVPPTNKRPLWGDGSCLVICQATWYALRTTSKQGLLYAYNYGSGWYYVDSIPYMDTLGIKKLSPLTWNLKKINLPKAGTAMASDGNIIYMIKGNGSTNLWEYTPGAGWSTRVADTIPNPSKAKGVKNGAALTYLDNLYLLKGNKTRQFWMYQPPTAKSEARIENNSYNVIASQSKTISDMLPVLGVSPNPFTKLTTIRYTVPVAGKVSLKLYNATGRLVETLVNEYQSTGSYTLNINNMKSNISKGIYFLKLETTSDTKETKLIIE
jgi:hypothetical protein